MSISYDLIPANIRAPGVFSEVSNSDAVSGVQLINMKVLLLGQKTSGGSATALTLVRCTNVAEARTLFGNGSMLAIMAEAAFASNKQNEMWFMPVADNGAGVNAAGSLTFAGTPSAAGTVTLYVAGKKVQISVSTTDTAASLSTALAAAIQADTTLPVTAAVDGSIAAKCNITAKNKGENGNGIDLRVNYFGETTAAGVTTSIVAMASGATNPDVTAAIAALGDAWFHVWANPYTDNANMALIEAELVSRFGPMREIEAHAFTAARGSLGALGTLGDARNSPHQVIMSAAYEPTPPWAKAAETAAIAAYHGSIDPARPLQTLPYAYCKPAAQSDQFTFEERNILLYDNIATTSVDAGGVMRIDRLVTTYHANASGASDESYLDTETLFTLMTIRHDWRDYIARKYPRHKLADDGTRFGAGQNVATPSLFRAEAVVKFREWEDLGLVENFENFKANMIAERNPTDPNGVNTLLPPDLMNQLRVVRNKIAFEI